MSGRIQAQDVVREKQTFARMLLKGSTDHGHRIGSHGHRSRNGRRRRSGRTLRGVDIASFAFLQTPGFRVGRNDPAPFTTNLLCIIVVNVPLNGEIGHKRHIYDNYAEPRRTLFASHSCHTPTGYLSRILPKRHSDSPACDLPFD